MKHKGRPSSLATVLKRRTKNPQSRFTQSPSNEISNLVASITFQANNEARDACTAANEDNSWHMCAANCEEMFEVRQLLYGDPEGQSASFVIMSRKTHENAESYINNALFLIEVELCFSFLVF